MRKGLLKQLVLEAIKNREPGEIPEYLWGIVQTPLLPSIEKNLKVSPLRQVQSCPWP